MSFYAGHTDEPRVRLFGEIAKQLVQRRLRAEAARYGSVQRAWERIVGEEVASHTRIQSFAGGCLTVGVATPALLHELNGFMRTHLLTALQGEGGARDVASIRFCLQQGSRDETV